MDRTAYSDLNKYFNVEPATINGSRGRKKHNPIKSKRNCTNGKATFYRCFYTFTQMACVCVCVSVCVISYMEYTLATT